jgi:hypothetical protein
MTVVQSRIHTQQLRNEKTAREMASDAAEDGDNVIVIFDRAAPDGTLEHQRGATVTAQCPVP